MANQASDFTGRVPLQAGYCIIHEHIDVLLMDNSGRWFHWNTCNGQAVTNREVPAEIYPCYGIFTETPPPPELTEEEWEDILSRPVEV